jgi:hypothetical protein
MKLKYISLGAITAGSFLLNACGSGGSGIAQSPSATALPSSFTCLPSQLPEANSLAGAIKIAYASNCLAESATQAATLQNLGISLQKYSNTSNSFNSNCSGTPIAYDTPTGVAFVVTAAHCVTESSANNINTYTIDETSGHNAAWVYQGFNAQSTESSQMGQILAVYVNSNYTINGYANDIAVLKIKPPQDFTIAPNVILAPANFNLNSGANQLMALGYGSINPDGSSTSTPYNLYYITYQYFANNSYNSVTTAAPGDIMNGYFYNNSYYSLICPGDSGGGDFAWDGSNWNLVGAHSYGTTGCGEYSSSYTGAYDVSTDVRYFNSWIQNILNNDNVSVGCVFLNPVSTGGYTCAFGSGV